MSDRPPLVRVTLRSLGRSPAFAVGALACALPAWRASRVDPATVLRDE